MCRICDGDSENEIRLDRQKEIDADGFVVEGVNGQPHRHPWGYTVGLNERPGHPELIVAGIELERAASLLTELAACIRAGDVLTPGRSLSLRGVELEFVDVHPTHLNDDVFASWFDHYRAFGNGLFSLRALQVVMPYELFCTEHAFSRPRLDRPGRALDLETGRTTPPHTSRRRRPTSDQSDHASRRYRRR